uniref:uncharacterized protein LOC120341141 n=1 Tax=Styela clava TaxID=7725 RepID=UPI00193A1101|nr:uncharacterized protein LOC120341141 [Styela clava]
MIIHGETLIQIPRYYSIEITDNNGITKWIFVKEENRFDSFAKGEDNKFWEPPCVAEDQSDVVTPPIEIMEAYDEDVPGSYDYPPPLKDIFNDSTNYEENDTELFNIKDILIPRDTTKESRMYSMTKVLFQKTMMHNILVKNLMNRPTNTFRYIKTIIFQIYNHRILSN